MMNSQWPRKGRSGSVARHLSSTSPLLTVYTFFTALGILFQFSTTRQEKKFLLSYKPSRFLSQVKWTVCTPGCSLPHWPAGTRCRVALYLLLSQSWRFGPHQPSVSLFRCSVTRATRRCGALRWATSCGCAGTPWQMFCFAGPPTRKCGCGKYPEVFVDIRNTDIDMLSLTCNQCCGCGFWIRFLFELWIRDPKWDKSQDPDPGWTTRIIFPRASKLKFFNTDPESGMEKMLIRYPGWKNSDPGSGVNIPDPQHCTQ